MRRAEKLIETRAAALRSQRPGEAAAFGAYLHGRAGQAAAERYSLHGILARDIADAVPSVMRAAAFNQLKGR